MVGAVVVQPQVLLAVDLAEVVELSVWLFLEVEEGEGMLIVLLWSGGEGESLACFGGSTKSNTPDRYAAKRTTKAQPHQRLHRLPRGQDAHEPLRLVRKCGRRDAARRGGARRHRSPLRPQQVHGRCCCWRSARCAVRARCCVVVLLQHALPRWQAGDAAQVAGAVATY